MTGRVVAATILLICGVALVAESADNDQVLTAVAGYLALLFVPVLIIDEAKGRP